MIARNIITSQRRAGASLRRLFQREEGSVLAEMGIGMIVFMGFFFGMIEFCYGLYAYNYVGEAAREASRFAMVRGSTCVSNLTSQPWCSPYDSTTTQKNGADQGDVTKFVQNLGFPGMQKSYVSVTTNWYAVGTNSSGTGNTWSTTPCNTATAAPPPTCNYPGNAVQVTVSYPLAIGIPFLSAQKFTVKSTSQMIVVQ